MTSADLPLHLVQHHPRNWRDNDYVYPVISRRSGGLSIGINLNPDTACNFDCVYCQVDRTGTPRVREVDPKRLDDELAHMIDLAESGRLYDEAEWSLVPPDLRAIRDIAFSGDGEPTTCPHFVECVRIAADRRRRPDLQHAKLVLITDACYLARPAVIKGLEILDQNNGEIWAKLDAGTEEYYREVNRPNYPLRHVMDNINATARVRPVVIQSLFMRLNGSPPSEAEIAAFVDRLHEIKNAGGCISYVQIYTVARRPAQSFVTPLNASEVDKIAEFVHNKSGLRVERYYGPS
ncbi:MAG: radical SAM protein [Planctomycetota bacterium]